MNWRLKRLLPQTPPLSKARLQPEDRAGHTGRRVLLNTGALAGSSLWRIGLSFVLQLLIANRLGAEGLGQYATALAYLNVCQVLSEMGLPMLLVRDLARTPNDRRASFQLTLLSQLGAAFLVWGGLVGLTALLPFQPTTRTALWVIGASLPFFAITSASETLFQAGERMELVMGVEVSINTLIAAASVAVLWRGGTAVHLVAVLVVIQALSAALCLGWVRHSGLLVGPRRRLWEGLALDLRRLWHRSVSFYGLALSNVLLHRLDILLLSVLAGDVVTGIYSAAYLIVRVLLILSQTYWQSLYPTLSRLRHQAPEQYRRLAALGIRYGLTTLLPVAALCAGSAEPLLGLIYAHGSYRASVAVFQVLVWVAPLFLTSIYAINLLLVEKLPRHSLLISVLHLATASLLLPPLTAAGQALGAAVAVLAGMALSAAGGLLLLHRARIAVRLRAFLPQLLLSTGVAGVAGALLPLWWPLRAALGAALYAALVWRSGVLSPGDLQRFRQAWQL